jgi:predicted transcriptional regulator
MSTTAAEAVADFLDRADSCYAEYEQGYTDADATLRKLDGHIEELRAAVEE